MADLLQEVDDAMRVERMTRLWEQYGNLAIGAIVLIVLATAGWSGWNSWSLRQDRAATSALLEAYQAKAPLAELEKLAKSANGKAGAIAALNAAAIALEDKKPEQALALYVTLSGDMTAPPVFRDLAAIQKASLLLDLKPEMKAADLIALLSPVASNDKSPWQPRALFLSALIKGEKDGKYEEALKDLDQLSARPDVMPQLAAQIKATGAIFKEKGRK
jgi:hypothetical protein